jgi:hypothetical protein
LPLYLTAHLAGDPFLMFKAATIRLVLVYHDEGGRAQTIAIDPAMEQGTPCRGGGTAGRYRGGP